MLDQQGYQALNDDVQIKEIAVSEKHRLIVSHSEVRARKDDHKRQEIIAKIKQAGTSLKGKLGSLYKQSYVVVHSDATVTLDEEKAQAASMFDGYRGYHTNTDLSISEIVNHYGGLGQVEQTFRITKHNLSIRPIYHYTDRRIKAHFALCFMSLSIVRYTETLLKYAGCHTPIEQLNQYLSEIKEVELHVQQTRGTIITDMSKELQAMFNMLHIPVPKRLTTSAIS